jgi:hypothetical protein
MLQNLSGFQIKKKWKKRKWQKGIDLWVYTECGLSLANSTNASGIHDWQVNIKTHSLSFSSPVHWFFLLPIPSCFLIWWVKILTLLTRLLASVWKNLSAPLVYKLADSFQAS